MTQPSVLIVVVTYNSAPLIPDLIASLPRGADHVAWKLVIADNDSSDDTVATIGCIAPTANVIQMGFNAGYAAGINAAVATSGPHDAVLILNPDVRLRSGCIPRLLHALKEPGIGIAVPRLLNGQGELILSMRREPSLLRALGDAFVGAERAGRSEYFGEIVSDPSQYDADTLTDWAEGSTQMISKECWNACGPWSDRFFLYSEEAEFDLRARDAGYATQYVRSAEAVHLEGDSATSPRLWALLTANRIRLFRQRNGLAAAIPFWIATTLREASRALLGRKTSRAAVRALLSWSTMRETPGPHTLL